MFEKFLKSLIEYNPKASLYDMNTLRGIEAIPVPSKPFKYNCDFTQSIEYVLQRKATAHKKAGNMDLAIACLKKSNQIMPYAPTHYNEKDYMRYIKYLRYAKRDSEADAEEIKLRQTHPELFDMSIGNAEKYRETVQHCEQFKHYDIIVFTVPNCPVCGKYNQKIYSINKKGNYPIIPNVLKSGKFECNHIIGYGTHYQ